MVTATLTSKGQITIPKEIRKTLNLHSGDKVNFFMEESGKVCILPAIQDITSLKGIITRQGKPVTVDEMRKTIRKRGGELV
jgi:AbrB family looped-hinge helix DNA binding protein